MDGFGLEDLAEAEMQQPPPPPSGGGGGFRLQTATVQEPSKMKYILISAAIAGIIVYLWMRRKK
jgi:hypothetical protein